MTTQEQNVQDCNSFIRQYASVLPEVNPVSVTIPSIMLSVHVGTSISFRTKSNSKIGRIIVIATDLSSIPPNEAVAMNMNAQFPLLCVNIFVSKKEMKNRNSTTIHSHNDFSTFIQEIFLTKHVQWIPISSVQSLVFIFRPAQVKEKNIDCLGMEKCFIMDNFFDDETKQISVLPDGHFYSFPSDIPHFNKICVSCSSEEVWDGINAIKLEFRRILCRTAISQGTSCKKTTKINFSKIVWSYIKILMIEKGIHPSKKKQTKKEYGLQHGFRYRAHRQHIVVETLIFNTISKLKALISLCGPFCFVGVRKCAPPLKSTIHNPNPVPTMLGDTLNVVNVSPEAIDSSTRCPDDRITLAFNGQSLSITICYSKCVLNEISSNSIKNPLLLSLLKNQGYQSSQDAAVHNFKIKLNQQFSDDNDRVFVVSKVHKDTIDALMI